MLLMMEQSRNISRWQMVLWQQRWVFATTDSLCYQKVRRGGGAAGEPQPRGRVTAVPFAEVLSLRAHESNNTLQLHCARRSYCFQLADRAALERWASNLVTLAQEAGHDLDAYVVLAPDEDEHTKLQAPHNETYCSTAVEMAAP